MYRDRQKKKLLCTRSLEPFVILFALRFWQSFHTSSQRPLFALAVFHCLVLGPCTSSQKCPLWYFIVFDSSLKKKKNNFLHIQIRTRHVPGERKGMALFISILLLSMEIVFLQLLKSSFVLLRSPSLL